MKCDRLDTVFKSVEAVTLLDLAVSSIYKQDHNLIQAVCLNAKRLQIVVQIIVVFDSVYYQACHTHYFCCIAMKSIKVAEVNTSSG